MTAGGRRRGGRGNRWLSQGRKGRRVEVGREGGGVRV